MLHCRYYQIGGMTIQVESELPITDDTFQAKFKLFQVDGRGEAGETVVIRHIFRPFDFREGLGERVYRRAPWAIYRRGDEWLYLGVSPAMADTEACDVAVLSDDHTLGRMHHACGDTYCRGGLHSLSMFTTDQILLGRVLADRQGCYLHSAGAVLDDQGLLFVGHSGAGKSTIARMLQDPDGSGRPSEPVEILCDDRNIVRRRPGGFRVYGTWSHGEWPVVSARSAPLRAILFLEQAPENRLLPLESVREVIVRLVACLIMPYAPADWWVKSLDLVEELAGGVPCYRLRFDRSGEVVDLLHQAFGRAHHE